MYVEVYTSCPILPLDQERQEDWLTVIQCFCMESEVEGYDHWVGEIWNCRNRLVNKSVTAGTRCRGFHAVRKNFETVRADRKDVEVRLHLQF